jgi:hypothetical protein
MQKTVYRVRTGPTICRRTALDMQREEQALGRSRTIATLHNERNETFISRQLCYRLDKCRIWGGLIRGFSEGEYSSRELRLRKHALRRVVLLRERIDGCECACRQNKPANLRRLIIP